MEIDENAPGADDVLDVRVIDPAGELVDRAGLSDKEISRITRLLAGLQRWREAEQRVGFRARSEMDLNESDMRALRYLVAAKNRQRVVTAGDLAEHLHISTASTTKLLDRLAAAGHIERTPHPADRRALAVRITDATHDTVRERLGRSHAHRFEAAARLTPDERETVIRFLDDLADSSAAGRN